MKYTIVIFSMLMSFHLFAQMSDEDLKKKAAEGAQIKDIKDSGWIKGGFFSTNLSSTTFSNWSQGGTNNLALVANSSLFAIHRSDDGKGIWENYLDLAYGVMRNGESKIDDPISPGTKISNPFVKNEDKLVFLTKYGRRISPKFNYSALLSMNTQMFPGWAADDILRRDLHISNLLAQGFGYVSIGLDYKPKPYLSVYFSPLTAKYTIVREQRLADLGLYGVDAAEYDTLGTRTKKGQTLKKELGWYFNINFNKDIAKNITYQSRLEAFQNYNTITLKETDFNWQNTITMKVNKYISVVLINQMIWDYEVDTKGDEIGMQRNWQLKNFFGLGFSAKFGDKL